MNDKVVLVTGSSRGIGRGIALKFAREGFKVVVNCSSSVQLLNSLVSEIREYNNDASALGFCADVSKYEEVSEMFRQIEEQLGHVDILINNAGISHYGLFNQMSPAEWNRVLEINLGSVLNCSHLAVPSMIRRHSGVIINISSIWGNVGASCEAVYSATKGAINSFSMALGKELGPSGIRVNAIACGVIDTDMNNIFSEHEKTVLREEIPLGRFGTVSDIANLAYFLASPESSFINAKVITSDGGIT